jgi:hypothetical protein
MSKALLHIGLDVHAQTIAAAIAEGIGGAGKVRAHGTISSDLHSVDTLLAKLRKAHPDLPADGEPVGCAGSDHRQPRSGVNPTQSFQPQSITTKEAPTLK